MRNPNKLIKEISPYLLQHAYNPVNWYFWNKEALEKAKKENKPIFLSIGYSTCHWCHVMEKESFEDEEIADFLNRNFVSIKVDREERPDIDAAYMQFAINTTGSGGWPLNVFLFPDLKPFFAGTYFPKEERYNLPSFLSLLKQIKKQFDSEANLNRKFLFEKKQPKPKELSYEPINNFNKLFEQYYDDENGGFIGAPKFPITFSLLFNIEQKKHFDKVSHTLKKIGNGGIYDHLAGGFSRYSTDEFWLIPHFEKTLYDNALLLIAYAKNYVKTKDIYFKEKADGIYNYLKNYLLSENGFYSGQDADSEGEEGKFYLFTYDEVKQNTKNLELFIKYFNVTKQGNYNGKNILHITNDSLADDEKIKVEQDKKSLLIYRNKREPPATDTKIIVSWNALVISALTAYTRTFQNKDALKIAEQITGKILKDCLNREKLLRIYGKKNLAGFLEDYSFFTNALLDIYEATKNKKYLKEANNLADITIKLFYKNKVEFSFTSKLHEKLYLEIPTTQDSVIPSGTSMMLLALYKLNKYEKNKLYERIIEDILKTNMESMINSPLQHEFMISGLYCKLSDG